MLSNLDFCLHIPTCRYRKDSKSERAFALQFITDFQPCSYLSNISYYRLRAYTFPFQDNKNEENDHRFVRDDIQFIIDLYCFDRRLQLLTL